MVTITDDWFKGHDVQWITWTDAIHFVLQGEAEITYWEPPVLSERRTVTATAPRVYLVPRGTRSQWRLLSDEPFRKLVADVPNRGFGAIAPPVGG
ncbi:MAG: cupin domain-containing protein [Chloroflexota bacterium]|nr:cupin domain-containing protein [Chloroflexota bacterium]